MDFFAPLLSLPLESKRATIRDTLILKSGLISKFGFEIFGNLLLYILKK